MILTNWAGGGVQVPREQALDAVLGVADAAAPPVPGTRDPAARVPDGLDRQLHGVEQIGGQVARAHAAAAADLEEPHLAGGQPRRMMVAWHTCRAMSVASTVRSQLGAASRNAWRRARDFPSGCGGLHTAMRITARRPAKRCLRDIAWPGVTAARLTPRSRPVVSGDVRPARRMLPLFPGERPCGREAMPGLVRRGMGRRIPAGMAARCRRPVERPSELPARGRPSRRSQRPSRAQASQRL